MAVFEIANTDYGLAALAQANATWMPINITHIAVGDSNRAFTFKKLAGIWRLRAF